MNVAVIGFGVGAEHVRAFANDPRCRVVTLCELSEEKAIEARRQMPGLRITAHDAEVFEDSSLDVVSIASFDDAHYRHTLSGLTKGKHIFVEKPLCQRKRQLSEIKSAWSVRRDLRITSNLVLREAPLYRALKEWIAAGELGEIYAFDGDYLYGRLHKITDGWRSGVDEYSVICGGGIHLIDLMLTLTGEKPSTVSSVGNRLCTAQTVFRYDDYVAATYRFPSGLIGRITANFGCVHRHQHVMRVFGTKATFLYDDQGPRLHRSAQFQPEAILLDPLPASKGVLVPGFVDSICDSVKSDNAVQHEFDLMSVCVAADEALSSGETIQIDYV